MKKGNKNGQRVAYFWTCMWCVHFLLLDRCNPPPSIPGTASPMSLQQHRMFPPSCHSNVQLQETDMLSQTTVTTHWEWITHNNYNSSAKFAEKKLTSDSAIFFSPEKCVPLLVSVCVCLCEWLTNWFASPLSLAVTQTDTLQHVAICFMGSPPGVTYLIWSPTLMTAVYT